MGKPKISHSKKNKASNFSNPIEDIEDINDIHINTAQNLIDTDFSILSGKTIASEDTWLEDKAISQLKHVETFENMCCVVGMPDLHPGIDAPIGAAYLSQNHIYPALVGSDIGCGIALWETNLMSNHASPEKLIKKLGNLDLGLDKTWYSHIDERRLEIGLKHADFDSSLGTIGGGNHFAEITQIDTIYDDYAEKYDLKIDKLHLLIHTGSRGLGQVIFKKYTQEGGNKGLNHSNIRSQQYLDAHDQALLFAQLNRELVAKHMLQRLQTTGREILSVHHNFVEKVTEKDAEKNAEKDAENIKNIENIENIENIKDPYFLHRKGAAPSDKGLVVIAGNRGDYSYLVEPRGSIKSLHSIAHGAGRKWKRSDCKGRLEGRYKHWRDLEVTQFGGRIVCEDRHLAYEEAPEAYKSIDNVIKTLLEHELIRVVARLKPIVTYKTMTK